MKVASALVLWIAASSRVSAAAGSSLRRTNGNQLARQLGDEDGVIRVYDFEGESIEDMKEGRTGNDKKPGSTIIADDFAHNGTSSVRIEATKHSKMKTDYLEVTDYKGSNIEISFYALASTSDNEDSFVLDCKVVGKAGLTNLITLSDFTAANNVVTAANNVEWAFHSATCPLGEEANRMYFRIRYTGKNKKRVSNYLYIDDIKVRGFILDDDSTASGLAAPSEKGEESDIASSDIFIQIYGEDVAIPADSQVSYDNNQDEREKRPLIVDDNGQNVTLEGNIHRAIPFPSPLSIGATTKVEVDFTLTSLEEAHAICFDKDLRHTPTNCFVFAGTQNLGTSWKRLEPQTAVGETRHYSIPIGNLFGTPKNYLIYMQDNDKRDRSTGSSSFANIKITQGTEFFIEQNGIPISVVSTGQQSYGSRQDSTAHVLQFSPDGTSIQVKGNVWRSIPLETPVIISRGTQLDFDFSLVDLRDIHSICFFSGNARGQERSNCFITAQTQDTNWNELSPQTAVGATRHYSVPIGFFLTGEFDTIAFLQDNDTSCRSCGDATWSNVKFTQVSLPKLSITVNGDAQEIDSSTAISADAGRQDTFGHFLEYPDSTSVTLKGNTHKALSFSEPIVINYGTIIHFDFKLVELEELHSICIVTDTDARKYLSRGYCFTAAGTQNWNNDKNLEPQTAVGETNHYDYQIGRFVPEGEAHYLVFMQDNDSSDRSTGECTFSNIEFSQTPDLNANIMGAETPIFNEQFSYASRQDTSDNYIDVSPSGDQLSMYGNLWKAFAFPSPVTVTDDTVLSFTLDQEENAEITGICLEEDLTFNSETRCFRFSGTQTDGLGDIIYKGIKETDEGQVNSYTIKLKEFYTGDMNYLVFIHDNDAGDRTSGISHFSDIRIYNLKPSCLSSSSFNFVLSDCTTDGFLSRIGTFMSQVAGCAGIDPMGELLSFFNVGSDSEVTKKIEGICNAAYASRRSPFFEAMGQEKQFIDEFFDGGSSWNYEVDEANGGANLAIDAARVKYVSEKVDGSNIGIGFPDDLHNFNNCRLRAAMCCWVAARDGEQKTEPDDNSDACYMDFTKAQESSHVRDGYSIYNGFGEEGPLNCHGFAWGNDSGYGDAEFRGNTLFQVAMMNGLYDGGKVEELPGAPMCGCIERMPVVTRADCTKTVVSQTVSIRYSQASGLLAEINVSNISHSSCGDLSDHYGTLVASGKATAREKELLDKHLVGANKCGTAITDFLATKGFAFS